MTITSPARRAALLGLAGLFGASTAAAQHDEGGSNEKIIETARKQPDALVGKMLKFENGRDVGPISAIRKRQQDQLLYVIVDATQYFNDQVEFAVPVGDLDRYDEEAVYIVEAPGNHLRGMVYHPEDYDDVN